MYSLSNRPSVAFNIAEYEVLFNLAPTDLTKKIVDFPAGLNSFTAEMVSKNLQVVACDPLYASDEIEKFSAVILKNVVLPDRISILKQFYVDFTKEAGGHYYVSGNLPNLPFANHQFDLMLSSFFFFSPESTAESCWDNLVEMLRVATEIRIYPLQNSTELLGPLMLKLQAASFGVEVRSIIFPKLPNAGMLRVWSQNCQL
jgi:hypothetical protein